MIKEDNRRRKKIRPLFHPAFGSRPAQVIGREREMQAFLDGLNEPVGSQNRCTFFLGQHGMGKTALLLELADRAAREGFVVARVTAYERMPEDIIESIQSEGSRFIEDRQHVEGFEAGDLGFSFGLTFAQDAARQYGFRAKLSLLCDELEKHGKGVLLLVDEAHTSETMRQVATTYQHLVGEDKDIAIAMAGLSHAVSGILNDNVLTFLNRAKKVSLGPISTSEIAEYYREAFRKLSIGCPKSLIDKAANSTRGFPYLMQLVGYYLVKGLNAGDSIDDGHFQQAVELSFRDLAENVLKPILGPLSDNDLAFLQAMAETGEISRTSEIRHRLGVENSFVQPYRARLIDAGIIESPRQGELVFAVPYLAEYLRGELSA